MLGFLTAGSTHGYDLYRQFELHLGRVWHISQSQLYATLKRLEARALILGTILSESGGPGRRSFSLTGSGRLRFDAWLEEASASSARMIRLEFVTRLFFAEFLSKRNPAELLKAQVAKVEEELRQLERELKVAPAGSAADDKFNRLGTSFRLNQLRALLAWLKSEVSLNIPGV